MDLLIPMAGRSSRFSTERPKWSLTMPEGKMMFESSIINLKSLNYEEVYVIAVKKQVEKMDYGLSFQMGHRLAFEFAEKLVDILPKDINHAFFSNSGSESVDSALKIALAYFKSKGKNSNT